METQTENGDFLDSTSLEGLEDMSLGSESEDTTDDSISDIDEFDYEDDGEATDEVDDVDEIWIEGLHDFGHIDWLTMDTEEVLRRRYSFCNLDVGYMFYNWYARINGFSARKSKLIKNKNDVIIQQHFVCHLEGFRSAKNRNRENRLRKPKAETRCGCKAYMKIHLNGGTGRWQVNEFVDDHNHPMLFDKFQGMLPAHRKMDKVDIMQMQNMRKVGINTPTMYRSFAIQSGGYNFVGFRKRDMYNQINKERKKHGTDANAALKFIQKLGKTDPNLFSCYTVDDKGRIQHLFWADGISRMDYDLFGDVLAFDATYRKNKYGCPLVILSGVNHHNKTSVFGFAIVSNESEQTYVWLLEQFLIAMKGKHPVSVVTDGDKAMRSAIIKVFPNASHRLCAWHLARNARTNMKNKDKNFVTRFKKCMLGDYNIGEFNRQWKQLIEDYDVQDHRWIKEMYNKRELWSTAYLRGKFFCGYRTTSRCEGLHSQVTRFVHAQNNLREFLHNLKSCVEYMRHREVEDDFLSYYGHPVLETRYEALERSATKFFTRAIFFKVRKSLNKAAKNEVVDFKQTVSNIIYIVATASNCGKVFHVSFNASKLDFNCSCLKMQSVGIPCSHIISVLAYLDIHELPENLVLNRWNKRVKESCAVNAAGDVDSMKSMRFGVLLDFCRQVCYLGSKNTELFNHTLEILRSQIAFLRTEVGDDDEITSDDSIECTVNDPVRVRFKGCSLNPSTSQATSSRPNKRCSSCRGTGHYRTTCPFINFDADITHSGKEDDNDDDDDELEDYSDDDE